MEPLKTDTFIQMGRINARSIQILFPPILDSYPRIAFLVFVHSAQRKFVFLLSSICKQRHFFLSDRSFMIMHKIIDNCLDRRARELKSYCETEQAERVEQRKVSRK